MTSSAVENVFATQNNSLFYPKISDVELSVSVNWQGIPFPVMLPINATVGRLKKQLSEFTAIPQEKIFLKSTWPPHNDQTLLASLDLTKEISVEERAAPAEVVEEEEEGEDDSGFSQDALVQVLDSVPSKSFKAEFEEKYGKTHPKVFSGTCKEAIASSKKSMVPLIIYLHSDKEESATFCKEVLSSSALSSFVDKNYLFWVCHANDELVSLISNFLGDSKFPILVVLGGTGGNVNLLELIQEVITKLSKIHSNFTVKVEKAKKENQERSAERMIIEEQDREFQESLQRDKERMKQREIEEEKQKIEEEKQKIEREKQEAEKKAKEEEKQAKFKLLPNEPQQGSDTTTIVIKLPDGSRLQRRFYKTDTVEFLYLFVDSKLPLGSASYDLVSNFPRKVFSDRSQTLLEGGLVPQGSLFISEHAK